MRDLKIKKLKMINKIFMNFNIYEWVLIIICIFAFMNWIKNLMILRDLANE